MTNEEFQLFADKFTADILALLKAKGTSYAGPTDRLGNFKRVAEALGVTPRVAVMTYLTKHFDSLCTYVRTGYESEGARSRCLDLANYCLLLAALDSEGT